ncbi:MAG TPA: tyrosine-type recombinase/integrase [Solirubrobacteraceae bacterium]|nr:tyrosine-type recombinase/integrase [Solirubrobacteraceae bacterium]HUB72924.1 tyrosine-type recombinase/integrase [Solirubrobacteraceae bacterium]
MARETTGQVLERAGKRGTTYATRVRAYGQRHYLSLGYSWEGYTRRHAETELQNILADIRRGIWKPPQPQPALAPAKDPTFHEFSSEWFEARRHEVSPRSVEDYRWGLTRHLLPFFKDHHLTQITIVEVDRYKTTKVSERERGNGTRTLSNGSINETLNLLAQILEVAVEYGHIQFNPARGRRRRLKAAQPKRTWLEPEQVKPLLDAAARPLRGGKTMPDPRMHALYATAICTGLRVGELLALRWQDVNLPQRRITVIDAKTEAGAGRQIDIWPELHDELAIYKANARHAKPGDFVFATASGKPDTRSNVAKRLKRTVQRANDELTTQGLPAIPAELSPHSLRRMFASLLYLRGENPVYVMHQMGHADPKLALRIYTKVMSEQRRRSPGARLLGVLDGPRWTQPATGAHTTDPGVHAAALSLA